ncbi:MAG: ATP-dependent helicase/nuclease subunit A [Gammaproteobacteria bacterium]|nr:ATP-dependent helicase/nuclease subunit A [Gammaproteobacteria bacterium]
MSSIEDQPVREQALTADTSFIVQAPAGSGKTELLIQRYLTLLGHVREPEEVIAITFTRKAAGEMRERIIDALYRAANGQNGSDELETRRLELARRAIANDREYGWQIIQHPARLQIQTIDALCLALTRQLPFLSGFAAPSIILEDANALYERAATETIRLLGGHDETWRDALRRFLIHLDNDMGRATSLLAIMLASRDQWLRHLGEDRVSPESLQIAWTGVIDIYLRRVQAMFPESLKESMIECADAAAAQLADARNAERALAWLEGDGFPESRIDDLPRWQFLADLLVTQSAPQWRKQINKKQGFHAQSDAKRAMQAVLATLSDHKELPGVLYALKSLPEPRLESEQMDTLDAMVTVLKLALAQLHLIFEESARVDFAEVTRRAIAALGALEDPSDLALRLDHHLQHLLVDEFQDTSMAQYHLLRLLTQGWAPGDGRTLFLVGDPMQSIYRFREAEVGVFLKIWEEGFGTVSMRALRLRSNFRASPRLVTWINEAFGECFPEVSDLQSGAVAFAHSSPQRADPGEAARMYVHRFPDCPESEQAQRLAQLIEQALGRSRNVAVLVRARSHLEPILPALQARNIPFSGMDTTALINEPVVRDLYSLTRALLHPGDRMAWLSLLRAPWCGLVLDDLIGVAGSEQPLIWNALRNPDVGAKLSDDGRIRIDRFKTALQGAMRQRGRLTLRQWVRRAWVDLQGPALIDASELKCARAYFELVGRHQKGMTLIDDQAFRKVLHSHWAHAEEQPGAVQLMTIHKAKGLEFDEVFIPALERPPRSGDKRLLLWEESVGNQGLLLATLSARGTPENKHYRFLHALQAEKSINETDRLLYVACTRARERLHLVANLPARNGVVAVPRKGSLLKRIWPSVEARFNIESPVVQQGAEGAGNVRLRDEQLLKRLPVNWVAPAYPDVLTVAETPHLDEQFVEFSWAGETARQVGIEVHELMHRIAADGVAQWNEKRIEELLPWWRDHFSHLGVPPRELDEAVWRTADSLQNLLEDERAEWLLRSDHAGVQDEYELNVLLGERVRRVRIDRTFVDDRGVRWIVDYKTSAHEGGAREVFLDEEVHRYREQLELYADAFRKMETRKIRLGLYFPLLKGWREWPCPD